MDIIFEIGIGVLSQLLKRRIEQERLVFDFQATAGADTFVFDHIVIGGLSLRVRERSPQPWVRPAGGGPSLDPFTFIPTQDIEGRLSATIQVAPLSRLRAHSPSALTPPDTIPIMVTVSFGVQLQLTDGMISLSINVRDLDFPSFGTEDEVRRAREQALNRLREITTGLRSAVDLSGLSDLLGTVPAILNAGVAVDEPSPGGEATFLQIGVQFEPALVPVDALEAARLAIQTSTMLRSFYAAPASRRGGAGWVIWLKKELLEQGAVQRTTQTLAREAGRLRPHGFTSAVWQPPSFERLRGGIMVHSPVTALNACGTDHHINVDVDASVLLSIPRENRLQLDLHFDYHVDGWDLFWCALEIGSLTGTAGFVIGGVFGGWIGALIGAIVGFLIGFVGAIIFAFAYSPELGHLDEGCEHGATDRDIQCQQSISFGSDLLNGLVINDVIGFIDGMALSGVLRMPAAIVPPRCEAAVFRGLHWARLPHSTEWGLVGDITVSNLGGGRLLIGSVVAIAGGSVWNGHFTMPTGPVYSSATIHIQIARSAVEEARAAGRLQPPEVLIFTTAGARVVRFSSVPDPISDDEIAQIELFSEALERIRALERGMILIGPPVPPGPRWFMNDHAVTTLLQVRVRESQPEQRLVLASETGQILSMTQIGKLGSAALDVLTRPFEENVLLLRVDASVADDEIAYEVMKQLESTKEDRGKIVDAIGKAFGNAIVESQDRDGGERIDEDLKTGMIMPVAGLFDVNFRKLDLAAVKKALDDLSEANDSWPGQVVARRTTMASMRLITEEVTENVQLREANGRQLVDFQMSGRIWSVDLNGLQVPVLNRVQSKTSLPDADRSNTSWWRTHGFVQAADRLLGPAKGLPGHESEDGLVVLGIVEQS